MNEEKMMLVPGMTHDLGGGFVVRRLLPYRKKRMVGPFIFLDHMGPVEFLPNATTDIRPHPHIGLSTLTYLFAGRILHRDMLGNVQAIVPGEVNWMTSGRGIVHSERAHPDDYGNKVRMEGLQFWVALPDGKEDIEPSFDHYGKDAIPVVEAPSFTANVVVGSAFGTTSPVKPTSPTVFVDVRARADTPISFVPEDSAFEVAVYVISGSLTYEGALVEKGQLAILNPSAEFSFDVRSDSHFIIVGGEAFRTPRLIWWNFVSSSKEKIEEAKLAWKEERFPLIPGDDQERIPLGE